MLYFLAPVYNEAENLPLLCSNLKNCLPTYKKFYVFVDDGSSDNSKEVISKSLNSTEFIILGNGFNRGPGYCFNSGIEWILSNSNNLDDRIVTIEADNTSDISILPKMVIISESGFDLVLASVYAQGGGFAKTSFFRKLLSSVANLILRFIYDIKIQTLSSFYRVYKIEALTTIKKQYETIITEHGFLCMIEILIKSIKTKASIVEVPMVLHSDIRKGKSKMKKLKTSIQYIIFVFKNKY